jgi:hypothetical protein
MKKLLIVLALVTSVASFSAGTAEVRVGLDVNSKFKDDSNGTTQTTYSNDVKTSWELAAEYRMPVWNNLELGDLKMYDSVPLYVTARYNFVNKSEFKPYAKMNLGYSFNMNDGSYNYTVSGIQVDIDMNAKNGLYAAIGGGVEYKGYTADLSYQTNYSSLSADYSVAGTSLGSEDLGNMNFNRITLGLGYNFGL